MILSTIILCLTISFVLKTVLAKRSPKKSTLIILSILVHFLVMFLNFTVAAMLGIVYKPGFATSLVGIVTYYIIKPYNEGNKVSS